MKIITCIRNKRGVTLLELLVVIVILSFIVVGLSELLSGGLKASRDNRVKTGLIDDANFAMDRIIFAARDTNWVFIPYNSNPVRGMLAISAMIDNDEDGVLDEDWGADIANDNQPGFAGFDDDGDGSTDEGGVARKDDDDEDGYDDEDSPKNGLDDDSGGGAIPDGNYDEEFQADMNSDGCPGLCFRDDDSDGSFDEGNINDDDEDGMVDEDPVDPLIFYVKNGAIYEREIKWNPSTSLSEVTEKKLIDNVSQFIVTRLLGANGKTLINVRIEVSAGRGNNVMLESEIYPRLHPKWIMP